MNARLLFTILTVLVGAAPLGAQPVLRLLSVEENQVRLAWPAFQGGGFVLERTLSAGSTGWTRLTESAGGHAIGASELLAQPARSGAGAEYYRLRTARTNEPTVLMVSAPGAALPPELALGLSPEALIRVGTNLAEVLAAVPIEGATVLLAEGTYPGGVVIPARVTLRGLGPERTRLVGSITGSALNVAGEDVLIEGLTLERPSASGSALIEINASRAIIRSNVLSSTSIGGQALIYVKSGTNQVIAGNRISGTDLTDGIRLEGGAGHHVIANTFKSRGAALTVLTGTGLIADNDFRSSGNTEDSLLVLSGVAANGNMVSNNLLFAPFAKAIYLDTGARSNRFDFNRIAPGQIGFSETAGLGNVVGTNYLRHLILVATPMPTEMSTVVPGIFWGYTNGSPLFWVNALSNAVALIGGAGAEVELGAGVFTGGVSLTNQVVLRGRGRGVTKVVPLTPDILPALRIIGSGVIIEDLTVDGQRELSSATTNSISEINGAITAEGAGAVIRRVEMSNTLGNGLFVTTGGDGLRLEDSVISNTATNNTPTGTPGGHGYGIFCTRAHNLILRSNLISGWAQGVGLWYGVTNATVELNRIVANFGFIDAAHTFSRSACEDFGGDVVPHGRNLWRSNVVNGSSSHCLEIAQGVVGSRFVGNTLRRPGQITNVGQHWEVTGQVGIPTSDIWIEGNDIVSDGLRADGCQVNGLASRITVTNNVFSGFAHPASNGPLFLGGLSGVTDVTVVNNRFLDSRFGIFINGDTTAFVVRSNLFENLKSQVGILVQTTGRGQVIGNYLFSTNFVAGIKLGLGGNNLVTGNVTSLIAPGLICESSDNVVTNNIFNETITSLAGSLRLDAGALRNLVSGNTLSSPDGRAIFILGGADQNIITNNVITSGFVDIFPTAGLGNIVTGNTLPPGS